MLDVRYAKQRGTTSLNWLFSRHTFSFGSYYEPQQSGFSDLLVINDDIVQAGQGFGTHPHRDMEIFTYVLDGALEHKDSMGNGSVIEAGDVQIMSAGSGITHSEFNHSPKNLVHFLQVWLVPNKQSIKPRYQQRHYSQSDKQGRLRLIISPDGENDSLSVYQDVWVYAGCFDAEEQAQVSFKANRFGYIQIVRGSITVNGTSLNEGDGARVRNESQIDIQKGHQAEILVFDLRPQEQPGHLN